MNIIERMRYDKDVADLALVKYQTIHNRHLTVEACAALVGIEGLAAAGIARKYAVPVRSVVQDAWSRVRAMEDIS